VDRMNRTVDSRLKEIRKIIINDFTFIGIQKISFLAFGTKGWTNTIQTIWWAYRAIKLILG
jgi:hypothetical protein